MTLGTATVKRRPVLLYVVFGTAPHQIIEFLFREAAQPVTLAARAKSHALHHRPVELQLLLMRRRIGSNF